MASSAAVGRRSRMSRIRWYSSGLRPSSANGCASSGVAAAFSTVSLVWAGRAGAVVIDSLGESPGAAAGARAADVGRRGTGYRDRRTPRTRVRYGRGMPKNRTLPAMLAAGGTAVVLWFGLGSLSTALMGHGRWTLYLPGVPGGARALGDASGAGF